MTGPSTPWPPPSLVNELQAAPSEEAVLSALLRSLAVSAETIGVGLGVVDEEHSTVRMEYGGAVPWRLRDRYHIVGLDAPVPLADAVTTGRPVVITDLQLLPDRFRDIVRDTGNAIQSGVIHPLWGKAGHVIGALSFMWPTPRQFSPPELDAIAHVATLTQVALERIRRLSHEHRIAVEFQEHLLDVNRSSTVAAVAAVYLPATEAMRVGGDWYLVTPLDHGARIGVSVGDVVGHGLRAAVVMSELRSAVAATAMTGLKPAEVLSAVDLYAATVEGARCATVAFAVVDIDSATVSYSCAGHPYPMLVPVDGEPRFLEEGRHTPMAVTRIPSARTTATVKLPPGGMLVLYTDGLVERPGESLDDGFARLRAAVADCAALPVGEVCDRLLTRLEPPGGYIDDVVVLAVRPAHASERSFTTVLPAEPTHLAGTRDKMRRWLAPLGIAPDREYEVLVAVGEALTNAIEHGSDSNPRKRVEIEAFLAGPSLRVTVTDSGQWKSDSAASHRDTNRGMGLTLMNAFADRVSTDRTPTGTRINLAFELAATAVA